MREKDILRYYSNNNKMMPKKPPAISITFSIQVIVVLLLGSIHLHYLTKLARLMINGNDDQTTSFAKAVSRFRSTRGKNKIAQLEEIELEQKHQLDPDATNCWELLEDHKIRNLQETRSSNENNHDFHTGQIVVTNTSTPFYISLHDPSVDRTKIATEKVFYQTELTNKVQDLFDYKQKQGLESIFVDVGANTGWFSLVAASHGASKVYSFEPNLQNVVRLCESIQMNQATTWADKSHSPNPIMVPIAKGVGNKEEYHQLYGMKNNRRATSTSSFEKPPQNRPFTVVGDVPIVTLDQFAIRHGWLDETESESNSNLRAPPKQQKQPNVNIGMLRLDAGRFDKYVLEGATRLLQSHTIDTIAMELKEDTPEDDVAKILELLYTNNYELVLHGHYKGPHWEVEKEYPEYMGGWRYLLSDIRNLKLYGDNMLFRRKGFDYSCFTSTTSGEHFKPKDQQTKQQRKKRKKKPKTEEEDAIIRLSQGAMG